ncbi:hypothetical protein PP408_25060 [Mycobacteroides abscessus]|uniref:hypothetical protein n=1 Tax=Mycobacteroides abscessus TaxID=36809 RepID=UPI000452189B|nr:hypothetical protein [Mycobacteroides abscessus]QSM03554.1 helix-turn-helix DNA binding domain protein [Mycobacterium phage prophiGD43A-1]ETZ64208.1 hypothetical protein L836_1285 [Mycobacteroides abscessus MAB_110811_2726]EUA83240.1 hypothetical protein I541_0015 [Mycobacteroides abscessus]MDM1915229.1 hypothetical protein [Mycobacteroides abscessus]MDM1927324.1 hypothetical protein [Mycobacteroides abscessus]
MSGRERIEQAAKENGWETKHWARNTAAYLRANDEIWVLWRYDKCELETYTALSAELKVNPRALNAEIKHGCEFHWGSIAPEYSEDEEGEAA